MVAKLNAVEVRLWGRTVGAVAALPGKPGFFRFQYASDFAAAGLELSPLKMPLQARSTYSFPGLAQQTYYGLPGLLADSLPDRFGNALIDEYLVRKGSSIDDITSLQRLVYVGKRAMGALEYEPAIHDIGLPEAAAPIEMAILVENARRALRGEFSNVAQSMIDVGSSAGGARAKAVIGWNPADNSIVSGQFDLPDGYEHWLLKFDGVGDDGILGKTTGFGRIEYAHYLMARDCGIDMSECRLLEEGGRAHFMSKRFDRIGNDKLHAHSLCGMQHMDFNMPYVHSYEGFFRTVLQLNLGADAIKQAWLRCVFNVMARNCDDHTKNIAFLMDATGTWSLAPAYDLCFAHNPAAGKWTRQHQMLIAGKGEGITRDDLLQLGDSFSIHDARGLLDQVAGVIAEWPAYAATAGVDEREARRIQDFHELVDPPTHGPAPGV
nr:type II toxin-antitoxin system HipA family toxin [Nitrosomonas nitrosa]